MHCLSHRVTTSSLDFIPRVEIAREVCRRELFRVRDDNHAGWKMEWTWRMRSRSSISHCQPKYAFGLIVPLKICDLLDGSRETDYRRESEVVFRRARLSDQWHIFKTDMKTSRGRFGWRLCPPCTDANCSLASCPSNLSSLRSVVRSWSDTSWPAPRFWNNKTSALLNSPLAESGSSI